MSDEPRTVPRGRHAPPLAVRLDVQRQRLFEAAAAIFARQGYADATAEAISREAGMSKATFYEHFANKEECILALFDQAAAAVMRALDEVDRHGGPADAAATYDEWVHGSLRAFLTTLTVNRDVTRTILVEIIGAGPRAAERRDAILEVFAAFIYDSNRRHAPGFGAPTFASRDDAFAVIGAIMELISRHIRTGVPADPLELEPTMARVVLGVLQRSA